MWICHTTALTDHVMTELPQCCRIGWVVTEGSGLNYQLNSLILYFVKQTNWNNILSVAHDYLAKSNDTPVPMSQLACRQTCCTQAAKQHVYQHLGTYCTPSGITHCLLILKIKVIIPGNIWQPLCSQTWPLKSMSHDKII